MRERTPRLVLEADAEDAVPSERELFLRHRDGEPDAFGALVSRYRAPVYGYLVRCGVSPEDRDDLFQEIFLRIHRAAHQYDAQRALHPWIFTVVANTVRTYQRKRRIAELVFTDAPRVEPPARSSDGEQEAAARQTAQWLDGELQRLPSVQREVLILTCVENVSQRDISEALGMPLNTVKTHLRRARLKLAERLADWRAAGDEASS